MSLVPTASAQEPTISLGSGDEYSEFEDRWFIEDREFEIGARKAEEYANSLPEEHLIFLIREMKRFFGDTAEHTDRIISTIGLVIKRINLEEAHQYAASIFNLLLEYDYTDSFMYTLEAFLLSVDWTSMQFQEWTKEFITTPNIEDVLNQSIACLQEQGSSVG